MPLSFFSHPLLLAAVAVAALGVVIYEIISENNNRNRYQNRPPPRGNDGRGPPPGGDEGRYGFPSPKSLSTKANNKRKRYKKSPPSASDSDSTFNSPEHSIRDSRTVTESSDVSLSDSVRMLHSSFPDSSVRKRHVGQNSLEAESTYTHSVFDEKFDKSNYCQNVLDNLKNDVKIIDGNVSKNLVCNIPIEESDSSENEEEKLINKICNEKDHNSNPFGTDTLQHSDSQPRIHVCPEEISNPLSNSEDTVNVINAEFSKMIEHDMPESYVRDEKEMNAESSDQRKSLPEEKKLEKVTESRFCKACEEKHINTFAHPCNHSYLCSDCAVKVFRLYKKCTICLKTIDRFVELKYDRHDMCNSL